VKNSCHTRERAASSAEVELRPSTAFMPDYTGKDIDQEYDQGA
jgi:hypothetical protein